MLAKRQDRAPFSFQRSLRGLFFGSPMYQMTLVHESPSQLAIPPQDMWPADGEAGFAFQNGSMALAGQTLTCAEPNFAPSDSTAGWRAALHRFVWLRDLRAAGGDQARRTARRWTGAWLQQFHEWHEEAWDPLSTALRLRHWLQNHEFFCASADDRFRYAMYDSIARQARHLSRVVPGILTGAELLAAYEGLIFARLAMPQGAELLQAVLRPYCRELDEQILSDGGHTSRSPGTLFHVLMGMMAVRSALSAARHEIPFELTSAIERAALMVKLFRHGDGGFALFHHTAQQAPVLLDAVLNQADVRRTLKSANASGYERVVQGRSLLILDSGQPAQAPTSHAGTLAFEFSSGKERIITNCGCYRGTGPWRAALASTAAHSTLGINDTNSSEFSAAQTASRRVRRRPEYVTVTRQDTASSTHLSTSHSGYRDLCGAVHARDLWLQDMGETLVGEDKISGLKSRATFAVRFHLHPSVQASLIQDGAAALLRLPSGAGWRFTFDGNAALSLEPSVYFGDGITQRRTSQLVLSGQSDSGITLAWRLMRERAQK